MAVSRRHLLVGCAGAIVPWAVARAQQPALPPFSTAKPGADLPPGWLHETLPKVERANTHAIELDAGVAVLRVRSRASASSLVATPAAPAAWTRLRWRWKVGKPLAGSDLLAKGGDDYAARLYVLFDLPLERLSFGDRLRLQAARSFSGRDLPAASICYVWGGEAQPPGTTAWNPYTDRVRMVVVDSGASQAGRWRTVERDLRRDWQEAFGGAMPGVRAVALSADTDNTGDSVDAWFGDIEASAG
jgi:hypothetical protein